MDPFVFLLVSIVAMMAKSGQNRHSGWGAEEEEPEEPQWDLWNEWNQWDPWDVEPETGVVQMFLFAFMVDFFLLEVILFELNSFCLLDISG